MKKKKEKRKKQQQKGKAVSLENFRRYFGQQTMTNSKNFLFWME